MKAVAFIPARYNSTRFKGKPLADICGRPMIWWVYQQVKKVKDLSAAYILTDHEKIQQVCEKYHMPCMMTMAEHPTSTNRVYEAAQKVSADIYLCINGDEPLICPETIQQIIPQSRDEFFAANLMTEINSPAEVVDPTNIKVVTDFTGNALFMSRNPIPYPKADLHITYYKHLGVLAYSMEALEFFVSAKKGNVEKAEDINELRFIEYGKKLQMISVEAATLSVDTPKDLSVVRERIQEKIDKGELRV